MKKDIECLCGCECEDCPCQDTFCRVCGCGYEEEGEGS